MFLQSLLNVSKTVRSWYLGIVHLIYIYSRRVEAILTFVERDVYSVFGTNPSAIVFAHGILFIVRFQEAIFYLEGFIVQNRTGTVAFSRDSPTTCDNLLKVRLRFCPIS